MTWEDRTDEVSTEIDAAFPTRTGRHDVYQTASRWVGNRHSKGALTALVNWLLATVSDLQEENRRLREAVHPHPGTLDTSPLILYFGNANDRAQFIELFKDAKPDARTYEVPPARPTLVK